MVSEASGLLGASDVDPRHPAALGVGEPGSPDRCSLGCRVEADSDLGAIGDVHLIARLQATDEGLHCRV